ncbi:PucR family transcriptional regulator [Cellulomonas wangsupingiae]|uniref:Helix-turn-helix domain-containing protein n=1 Tax=Cellulomonas wangsupingiae TaxID=2968085 RepID=A0ABY5K148_9CELL|nr:helix-turn-helix domain-containing protein [Cellulomonas wangsupingiae]MCC2333552.1 helix-turn-helix domain-containing protein [Cellulomonas wangsupingiae]MCM0638402.1 helix-turn-helix domain-containing protein [Cellulomonas wangsupingiae]UUI63735.1 helix-turn-helix domain-containing protein [Cellulomonas wangsupingiae]
MATLPRTPATRGPRRAAPAGPAAAPGPQDQSETQRRVRDGTGLLATAAMRRLDADLEWYRALPAEDRSWVNLVAQAGITAFVTWYADPSRTPHGVGEIFASAPPELTRSISLQHTLQLVRVVVDVVETHSDRLAAPGAERELREAVMRYSREVAFSAAEVYARAAEVRGAWDARLEALVVDALVRGDADDALRSRVAALGWGGRGSTLVVVGTAAAQMDEVQAADLRRATRRAADDALVGILGDRLVVFLGGEGDLRAAAMTLLPRFGPGPVVVGPTAPGLAEATGSARAALAGLAAAPGWQQAPRPVHADDLLPERVLVGDAEARRALVERAYAPLAASQGALLDTLSAYLGAGRSLEAAARTLYVHPNTVRYRLRRVADVTGWDPLEARESYVLQTALAVGRLDAAAR